MLDFILACHGVASVIIAYWNCAVADPVKSQISDEALVLGVVNTGKCEIQQDKPCGITEHLGPGVMNGKSVTFSICLLLWCHRIEIKYSMEFCGF